MHKVIKENKEVAEYLRTLVVKHPTEWSLDTYDDDLKLRLKETIEYTEDEFTAMKANIETNLVFWDNTNLPAPDNLWYMHPIYFLEHLRKTQTENPYMGKTISKGNRTEHLIKDCPGFAPFIGGGRGYSGFATITGLFNQDYGNYNHEGVDFAGARDFSTPIKSFIDGIVVAIGDQGNRGYGKFIIILDRTNLKEMLKTIIF